MCIKLTILYKGCNCIRESLNPCPTFQKKKSGFWSSLFGAFKHEKHCGKLRRSRQNVDYICDDCAIRARGLLPHRVGEGVNLPRRKVADESFRRERRRSSSSGGSGRRSPRHRHHHKRRSGEKKKRHSRHAIPTDTGAWVPNLYEEAKQVPSAPPEYGRKYAPAPPVCPPRPSRSTREPVRTNPHPSSSSRRHHEKKSGGGSSRHGKSSAPSDYTTREDWPLRAPAEPQPAALRPGGLRTQGPNGPPPQVSLPPLPKQTRTYTQHAAAASSSNNKSSVATATSFSRPGRPGYCSNSNSNAQGPAVPPVPYAATKKHPLRRQPRQRQVQRHPPPPLNIQPPSRPPLYMEYLADQNSELMQRYGKPVRAPPIVPTRAVKPQPAEAAPKRSKLEAIGVALGFDPSASETDSDVSFACVDARRIEAGQSTNPMGNQHHAAPRRR